MNNTHPKIIEFLQGNEPNLIGTIIGITRVLKPKFIPQGTDEKINLHDSCFLFFDHRTARIEIFLFNRGKTARSTFLWNRNKIWTRYDS